MKREFPLATFSRSPKLMGPAAIGDFQPVRQASFSCVSLQKSKRL